MSTAEINKLKAQVQDLESMKKSHKVHIQLMDEYRQEMNDLRIANGHLRTANEFLKKAADLLRSMNRRLRYFKLNVA